MLPSDAYCWLPNGPIVTDLFPYAAESELFRPIDFPSRIAHWSDRHRANTINWSLGRIKSHGSSVVSIIGIGPIYSPLDTRPSLLAVCAVLPVNILRARSYLVLLLHTFICGRSIIGDRDPTPTLKKTHGSLDTSRMLCDRGGRHWRFAC